MSSQFVCIPLATSKETRTQANALLSIIGNIYSLIGPILGVSMIIGFGFQFVLIFDAATFLIALVLLRILFFSKKTMEKNWQENSEVQENNSDHKSSESLPLWSNIGLLSWFFCSVAISMMVLP